MKPLEVETKKIKMEFDIRVRSKDPRYEDNLAILQNNGVTLPPIKIYKLPMNGKFGLMDGRHRLEAAKLRGKKTIRALVVPYNPNELERRLESFKENIGGALPPTKEDYEMLVKVFLRSGMSHEEIVRSAPYLRGYINSAAAQMSEQRRREAAKAVSTGKMTVKQASKHYGVKEDAILHLVSLSLPAENVSLAE
jgi:hypothetical protein